jgi:hypothetical protein
MNIKTEPYLQEPDHPVNVALANEESSKIEVFLQKNRWNQRLVNVHIRYSSIDSLDLDNPEELESKIIQEVNPNQLKRRFFSLVGERKPIEETEKIPYEYYVLTYDISAKDKIYEVVKGL